MKKIKIVFFFILSLNISVAFSQNDSKRNRFINDLMSKMTIDEKIGQLNLISPPGNIQTGAAVSEDAEKYIKEGKLGAVLNMTTLSRIKKTQEIAVSQSRLKIPLIFGLDVIHGYKTGFPIPLALSASWRPNLAEKVAQISAKEASADGINWTYSPMADIGRDPRWGRVAEGAGEDPFLASRITESFVRGYQGNDLSLNNTILACVKHFALYGASEAGRDYNSVDMSKNRMYNEYFPPYKAAIDAGVGSVMTSFNDINGVPSTANKWLLTDVLRKQWGFNGFVVTDFTAIKELIAHGLGDNQQVAARAFQAGTDMDMVGEDFLKTLKKSLDEGKVLEEDINKACRRILEMKYNLGLFDDPYRYIDEKRLKTDILTAEHRKIAREIAAQTFVLMKNDQNALPFKRTDKIAFIGPLLDDQINMPGTWAVATDYRESITLKAALEELKEKNNFYFSRGCNITENVELEKNSYIEFAKEQPKKSPEILLQEAIETAKKADKIVLVLGEASEMTGECSSRTDIRFPGNQLSLLREMKKLGKPIAVVLFTGRPLDLTNMIDYPDALLNVWFPGIEAGHAITDVLFGQVNPSGKLSMTFPRSGGQIPIYYNHKNTGRPLEFTDNRFEKYKSNYLDEKNTPLFPFGFGLSYTQFKYGELQLSKGQLQGNETLKVSIAISNIGNYDGEEIVQLYIRDKVASITRPVKELKGFKAVSLNKNETKTITFDITPELLKFYNEELTYDWEEGEFDIMIGTNSQNLTTKTILWKK
ncbi:beta-glucosidase BglX [Pedobacter yonginense]|uniref:Periplasmic beta-glucosidase n=1 Tax=Pedobacter yonginense TaxID=651869 RepID=A0A317EL01_9SPHI|nr:beta-glucosidase BglX [Pedobacter yonginense]PWS27045.1 beta-glucosidase BglX [Pedobacter yonginense]